MKRYDSAIPPKSAGPTRPKSGMYRGDMFSERMSPLPKGLPPPTAVQQNTGIESEKRKIDKGLHTRRIKDDRYYLSLIHQHAEKINQEYKRLKAEIAELTSVATVKNELEKKHKTIEAEKIDLKQKAQKSRYISNVLGNEIIISDIPSKINEMQIKNQDLLTQLEDIYVSRKHKEQLINDIKKQISEENSNNEKNLLRLTQENQQKYHRYKAHISNLNDNIKQYEKAMRKLETKYEFYKQKINNPMKNKQLTLIQKYNSCTEERENILKEIKNTGNVEVEQNKLLEKIRQARNPTNQLEKEIEEVKKTIVEYQENLEAMDLELQEGYSARHAKYLELTQHEERIDQYWANAEERLRHHQELLNNTGDIIREGLQYWSFQIDDTTGSEFTNEIKDIENGKMEYEFLKAHLKNMNDKINELKKKITENKIKYAELESNILEVQDPKEAHNILVFNHQELVEEKELLIKKINATKSAIDAAMKKNQTLSEKISNNKVYSELKTLQEKIQEIDQRIIDYKNKIEILKESANIEKYAQDALSQVSNYNTLLKNMTGSSFK